MTIRAVIVDDEPLARRRIGNLLAEPIHRSTIVNIDRIQAVESLFRGEYLLVLRDKTELTSGRSYRGNVHRLMGKES